MLVSRQIKHTSSTLYPAVRYSIAVLLFTGQLYAYGYYYGINSEKLYEFLNAFVELSFLQDVLNLVHINNMHNMVLPVYIVCNACFTVGIVSLVYGQRFPVQISVYLISSGLLLYIFSNLLQKATGIFGIGLFSVQILNFIASPLTTILLIPALKLIAKK